MLNLIWSAVIGLGILMCFFTGNAETAAQAFTDGAAGAVELCIFVAGTMSFWSGKKRAYRQAFRKDKAHNSFSFSGYTG